MNVEARNPKTQQYQLFGRLFRVKSSEEGESRQNLHSFLHTLRRHENNHCIIKYLVSHVSHLKSRVPQGRAGSIPALGTSKFISSSSNSYFHFQSLRPGVDHLVADGRVLRPRGHQTPLHQLHVISQNHDPPKR